MHPRNTDTVALNDVAYLLLKKYATYDINITTPNQVDNLQQDWNRTNEMSRVFDLVKLAIITCDVGQGNAVTPSMLSTGLRHAVGELV